MGYVRKIASGAKIGSKRSWNTAGDWKGGGNKKQGLAGQSVTKTGPTLSVNHRCAQRSVMRYNNGLVSCTDPSSGGVGARGSGGVPIRNKMGGLRCQSSPYTRPQFGGGARRMFCYGFINH